jgi:hypothetical protein
MRRQQCQQLFFGRGRGSSGDTWSKNVTRMNVVIVRQNTPETRIISPRVAFITFAHLQDFSWFEKFIFPALDTFLQPDNDLDYVVLQNETRHRVFRDLCRFNVTYSKYCERVVPIFVDCPEGNVGDHNAASKKKVSSRCWSVSNMQLTTFFIP